MEAVLRERGLLTPAVAAELAAGRRYWREERRLCSLMRQHPTVPPEGHGAACSFTLAEALSASGAKVRAGEAGAGHARSACGASTCSTWARRPPARLHDACPPASILLAVRSHLTTEP